MKPLLHRRTFWKGVAAGATVMATLIIGSVVAVSLAAPEELSRGVRSTWEPTPSYENLSKLDQVTLPPCDTRGKDCTVFEDPVSPFTAPVRTVPEPSSLWLLGVGAVLAVRNTLYAALTVALVSVGRWFGMREEDE